MDDAASSGGGGSSSSSGEWPKEVDDIRNGVGTMLSAVGMRSNEIEALVLDFSAPLDIGASKDMTDWIKSAKGVIAGNMESGLGKIQSKMDTNWAGDAANGFTDFVTSVMDSIKQQKDILDELQCVMAAYHEAVAAMKTDLIELVGIYQKAFEERGEDATVTTGLTIAATVAGVAASTGPVGVAASVISGVSTASTIGGDDAVTTAVSLGDALEKLRKKVDKLAGQIAKAFKDIRGYMKEDDVKAILKPSDSDIINGVDFNSDEFVPKGVDGFTSANDEVSTKPLVNK